MNSEDVFSIETAPKDGTEILGIYGENEEVHIQWTESRRCMLAGYAGGHGYFGPGWEDCYNKLIVDEPRFWKKIE